jgi:hypothetical protein
MEIATDEWVFQISGDGSVGRGDDAEWLRDDRVEQHWGTESDRTGCDRNGRRYGILRLTAPVGLTTGANSQLAAGCPSGKFTNPQTELSMRDFIIVQYYTVTTSAVCE